MGLDRRNDMDWTGAQDASHFVKEVKTTIDTNGVSVPQDAAVYSQRLARDLEWNVPSA
jgi:hypothetical protein